MPRIQSLKVGRYRIPLPQPMQDSSVGVMTHFELVTAMVTDAEGQVGAGYTVTHQGQGGSVAAIIDGPFRAMLIGEEADQIEWIWRKLHRGHHYCGRGGPVSFALAAVDTALWDLKGRRLGQPLWRLLGGYRAAVPTYAGNIDLNLPMDQLVAGGLASVAAGFKAVKMRLGRPSLAEDVARVAAMRAALPAEVGLLADANEAWRVDQAVHALRQLAEFQLIWLEEPLNPDNTAGYAHLRSLGLIPLALGENLHTVPEFTALIAAGGVDFPEPDLTTCGGITPFMKIARLAEAHGLSISSHGVQELHVHLLAACPNAAYLEWHAFDLGPYMAAPLTQTNGVATAPDRPGHGVDFDWDKLIRDCAVD